eukprot:COSAG06_NODE_3139_length_5799_cov_50.068772_4_plen_105_part_00
MGPAAPRPVGSDVSRILPRVDLMNSAHAATVAFEGKKGSPTELSANDAIDRLYRRDGGEGGAYRPGGARAHELAGGLRGARGECWAVNYAETPRESLQILPPQI